MSYNQNNPNGSATSANSSPVVIALDQLPIPVSQSGTWSAGINNFPSSQAVTIASLPALAAGSAAIGSITNTSFIVTQATAANLNATVIGTGTFATQVTSLPSLAAGSAAIGSVSVSNFPSSQAVTITTLPSLAAGSAAIGSITNTSFIATQATAANLNATVVGTVTANAGTGTFAISAASLPLPTGAATAANQTTTNASLATIATNTTPINIAQGAAITGLTGDLSYGSVTTAAPTYTTGTANSLSLNTAGALRVDASGTTQTVTGTVTANASPSVFDFSSTNLAAAATYTTQWFDSLTAGGGFSLSVFADQPITYNIQFSPDNGTTVRTMDTAVIPASTSFIETHIAEARYFRVSYANSGASTTTSLFLSTVQRDDPLPEAWRITDKSGNDLVLNAKGVQGTTALPTQDLKDSGRNQSNLFMLAPIITTATDALQSLTGYKSGAAVTASTTPAVVTATKTLRINSITIAYVAVITEGNARFTLRANTAGVVALTSPAVITWDSGNISRGTAGETFVFNIPIPDGMEFAAGTGIGVSMQGFGATGTAAAVGYASIKLNGYEY